jgi:hypothetical protein
VDPATHRRDWTSIAFDQDGMDSLGHNADRERISRHISAAGGIYFPIAGSIAIEKTGTQDDHSFSTCILTFLVILICRFNGIFWRGRRFKSSLPD